MILLAPILAALHTTLEPAQGPTIQDLFVVQFRGCEAMAQDPKDQGLVRALSLVEQRLSELPAEIGEEAEEIPLDAIHLAHTILSSPMSVRVGMSSEPIDGMPIPICARAVVQLETPEAASQMLAAIRRLDENGKISDADPAGWHHVAGNEPIWLSAQGSDVVFALGLRDLQSPTWPDILPDMIQPNMAMHMDYGAFMTAVMEEEQPEMGEMLEAFGVTQMKFQWAAGHDDQRSVSRFTMPGYGAFMREKGVMPTGQLTPEHIAIIPENTTWASTGVTNLDGSLEMIAGWAQQQMEALGMEEDPIEMVAMYTGIHLRNDLINHLGDHWGMYASDTTGGGDLTSMVMFIELSDAEGLAETDQRISQMLNGMAAVQARGYARVQHWEHAETKYTSLVFPGLPVPIEPTIAYGSGYLFIGATPQAAMGAIYQAQHGGRGLLDNANFVAQFKPRTEEIFTASFYDTPRFLKHGYAMANMMTSALVNGTRSPVDETRDAGIIMPPYYELAAGALASVSWSTIQGDDVIQTYHADRSVLVNMTGAMGFLSASPLLLGMFVGAPVAGFVAEKRQAEARSAAAAPERAHAEESPGEHVDQGDH